MLPLLAAAMPGMPRAATSEGRACVGDDCSYPDIQSALTAATDGAVVTIRSGVHPSGGVLRASGVTVRGEEGAKLVDAAVRGKAALVIQGRDTVIEDLECSNNRVAHGNGACVRLEAQNLTLRRVHFHENEMGILTGRNSGRVVIEDSVIENNGLPGSSLGHNIYIGGGDELVIRRSRVLAARNEGHEVKSRAAKTTIEDSVIANLDSVDSRTIDLPFGGEILIRNSVIHMGPASANWNMIGIGLERRQGRGDDVPPATVTIENNFLISDRAGTTHFLDVKDVADLVVRGNTFVGGDRVPYTDGNTWYRDRAAAGLGPFPELPQP